MLHPSISIASGLADWVEGVFLQSRCRTLHNGDLTRATEPNAYASWFRITAASVATLFEAARLRSYQQLCGSLAHDHYGTVWPNYSRALPRPAYVLRYFALDCFL